MAVKSILGNRLGISRDGVLRVDGRDLRGKIPTLGTDIFVDSVTGDDNHSGLTPESALATLDAAFAKTTANKGDVIYVMPNHAETISTAGGIAHDVAGVSVIGLGRGGQRPNITMDTADTTTYLVSAADAYIDNLVFTAGLDSISVAISVVTGKDCWINRCEAVGSGATDFDRFIGSGTTTDNLCDGLKVTNCVWNSATIAFGLVLLVGDHDRVVVQGNTTITPSSSATNHNLVVVTDGDDLQHILISDNVVITQDTAGYVGMVLTDVTDNTGIVLNNRMGSLDTAGELMHAANSGLYDFQNYSTSVVTASGYLLPAADS